MQKQVKFSPSNGYRITDVIVHILKHIVFAERVKFIAGLCLAFLLWPFRRREQGGVRKILVVPIVSRLGDLVCSTPVYRELAHALPSAHLAVLCAKNVLGIIKHNPHISEIINLNAVRYKGFMGRFRLLADIRGREFDAVVSLTNNPFGNVVAAWSGAPLRIKTVHYPRTLAETLSDWFSNVHREYRDGSFLQTHYLALLAPLGVSAREPVKEVFTTEAGERKAEAFLAAEGIAPTDTLIGISVSAGNTVKEWPPERFAGLADRLIRERGAKIVFVDAPADEPKIEHVISAMREKRNISIATNFTLEELPSLIKRLSLFIAVDTGTVYIAHALGVPLVDIIGPVEPNEQPPRDARSIPVLPPPPHAPSSFVLARPGSWEARRAAICATSGESVYTAAVTLLTQEHAHP